MRKRTLIAGMLFGMVLCATTVSAETVFDEKEIEIPGLQKEYTIAVVNDQHIIVEDGDYAKEKEEDIRSPFVRNSGSCAHRLQQAGFHY